MSSSFLFYMSGEGACAAPGGAAGRSCRTWATSLINPVVLRSFEIVDALAPFVIFLIMAHDADSEGFGRMTVDAVGKDGLNQIAVVIEAVFMVFHICQTKIHNFNEIPCLDSGPGRSKMTLCHEWNHAIRFPVLI